MNKVTYHDQPGLKLVSNTTVFYCVSFQYQSFTVSHSNASLLLCLIPIPQPFYVSFQYHSHFTVSFQYHSHFLSHSNTTAILLCPIPIPQPFYYVSIPHFLQCPISLLHFVLWLPHLVMFHSNHILSVVSAYCGCRGAMWYAKCVSQDLLWLCKG